MSVVDHSSTSRLAAREPILFVDGAAEEPALLRWQILSPVRAALGADIEHADINRVQAVQAQGLRLATSPNVQADVLMMFDLADREHMHQSGPDGVPLVRGFSRILVPGQWLARTLLGERGPGLSSEQVVVVGSPRVDMLRKMQADRPTRRASTRLRTLFMPLHGNWLDSDGVPMAVTADMKPYLPMIEARCDLTVIEDGRNTRGKKAVTDALLDADVVITDFTAVMYEAWALGKPVIFPHWLCADRLEKKAPHSAEAHVYREKIGHHPESIEDMLALLDGPAAPEVDERARAFVADYIQESEGEGSSGRLVATLLERLARPGAIERERATRVALPQAMEARDWAVAEKLTVDLLKADPVSADLHAALASIFHEQGVWWREAIIRETLTALDPTNGCGFYNLGLAQQRMGDDQRAAHSYGAAIRLAPGAVTWEWHYRLAFCLEAGGDSDTTAGTRAVREAYDKAARLHPDTLAITLGPGFLHAEKGFWPQAQAACRASLQATPMSDELHGRLGMACERCYDWAAAETAYACAVALAPERPDHHYHLGFVRERRSDPDSAAEAYLHAIALSDMHRPSWHYRAGYVLEMAGRLADACTAFAGYVEGAAPRASYERPLNEALASWLASALERDPENAVLAAASDRSLEAAGRFEEAVAAASRAALYAPGHDDDAIERSATLSEGVHQRLLARHRLDRDCSQAVDWRRYGRLLRDQGDVGGAIDAYRQAMRRSDEIVAEDGNTLGMMLMETGHLEEACAAFREQCTLRRPHGVDPTRFKHKDPSRDATAYREFYDTLPLLERTVLYESFGGTAMACNPLAIFDRIKDDPAYAGWLHIWVLNDPDHAPLAVRARRDVIFCTRGSTLYKRYLATTSHLINNATFPSYFVRRDGQKYLNTWHGTPLKSLGMDIRDTPLARANTVRNFLHASHLLFPNEHTRHVTVTRNNAARTITADRQITGYPRIDSMLNATAQDKARLKESLGIDPEEKVVLYAPTYRGYWDSPEIETDALVSTVRALRERCSGLLFRGHYFAEERIAEIDLPCCVVPHAVDTCTLLSIVDVLITDYSSIFYDYLPSGKPILHLADDWDQYARTRGVYFALEDLPGLVCRNLDALLDGVDLALSRPDALIDDTYRQATATFCPMEDGRSTERAVEFFFETNGSDRTHERHEENRHMTFYAGTLTGNGVAAPAIVQGVAARGIATTVIVERRLVADDPGEIAAMKTIAECTDVIIRTGDVCNTPEEAWVTSVLGKLNALPCEEMYDVYARSTAHEYRRIMGHAQTDCIIDLDGRAPYRTHLVASSTAPVKALVLHGDLALRSRKEEPHLARGFAVYNQLDRLIAFSDAVMETNRVFFGAAYGIDREAFRTVSASLDAAGTRTAAREAAREDPACAAMAADPRFKLVSLSPPEDGTFQLIAALAALVAQGNDISLRIPGTGALPDDMRQYVVDRGLKDRVFLMDARSGLLPYLAMADCAVLSSDCAEADDLVLKAMLLDVPCVSTDVKGLARIMSGDRGLLVDCSTDALASAILDVKEGRFLPPPFDLQAHNDAAIDELLEALFCEKPETGHHSQESV